MTNAPVEPQPIAGYFGFALGAAALMLVLVHFWSGPFAPQQRASVSIGEIAADIRTAAVRKLSGEQTPIPQPAAWDVDRVLRLITAILAGIAVIAGVAGLVRRETWRPAAAGITLGCGAVAFQLFTWTILLVVGALILCAIIFNVSNILGS